MRLIFVLLFAALVSCSQNSCINIVINQEKDTVQKTNQLDKNYLSVVRFIAKEKDNKSGGIISTGFAISRDYLLTAGHFCTQYNTMLVENKVEDNIGALLFDGDKFIEKDGFIVSLIDEKQDICLISRPNHRIPIVSFIKNYSNVSVGNKISIIGAPGATYPSKVDGYVIVPINRIYQYKSVINKLMLSVNIYPGSSGSPVFDENNRVIGMIVAGAPGVGVAVRTDIIVKFIKNTEVKIRLE